MVAPPTPYASLADVYDLGFAASAFVKRPRPLDISAGDVLDFASGTFWQDGHGYRSDDFVRFVLPGAGALPGGASTTQIYSPIPIDRWRFQLATSPSGSPVTFSDAGTSSGAASSWGLQLDPERRLSRIILNVSGEVDQDLTAHAAPLIADPVTGRFPEKVIGVVAREAARRGVVAMLFENAAVKTASERVFALQAADDEQRKQWREGQPILPQPAHAQSDTPYDAPRATGRPPLFCRTRTL